MKLMKIFGMVFALHVALICILFSIQGCRSTPAPRAETAEAEPVDAPVVEPVSENWTNTSAPSSSSALAPAPVSDAPLTGLSPAERARMSPTRPENPDAFISTGTPSSIAPPPPEPASYVVRSGDSFWKIARAHGTTTSEIQRLNPGIRADALRPGMMIKIPGTANPARSTSPTNPSMNVTSSAVGATYVVRSGDSLSKIAARNGTTVSALREMNNLRSDVLQIGQELKIPARPGAEAQIGGAPSSAPLGGRTSTDSSGNQVTITVQRGDTLGEIAQKYAVTVADLMAANNISNPTKVRVGQTLVIPGFQAVGSGSIPRTEPPRTQSAPPTSPLNPPEVAPPVEELTPAAGERPPEFDAPDAVGEAPPVQPLDEPMPAP